MRQGVPSAPRVSAPSSLRSIHILSAGLWILHIWIRSRFSFGLLSSFFIFVYHTFPSVFPLCSISLFPKLPSFLPPPFLSFFRSLLQFRKILRKPHKSPCICTRSSISSPRSYSKIISCTRNSRHILPLPKDFFWTLSASTLFFIYAKAMKLHVLYFDSEVGVNLQSSSQSMWEWSRPRTLFLAPLICTYRIASGDRLKWTSERTRIVFHGVQGFE